MNMEPSPDSHAYKQSSVYSYKNTGEGEPEVYEAHHTTRTAPGGVSITRYYHCNWLLQKPFAEFESLDNGSISFQFINVIGSEPIGHYSVFTFL